MAYNKRYNPDALPAHVEPEQAALLLSTSSSQPARASPRPQPPIPQQSRPLPEQNYGRPLSQTGPSPRYGSSDGSRPPSQYQNSSNRPRNDSYSSAGGRRDGYGGGGSPPPAAYGYGRQGPPPAAHGRPPATRPPSVVPPRDGNDRDALWPLFKQVDRDGSGQLSESELRSALVNGDWSKFDPQTVRMMIRMFDADRNGTISFDEFCGLWGFLAAWRGLFDRFDVDRSGNISYDEFKEALVAFGYRLSPQFVSHLFRTYDRRHENAMSFDLFVQACISLKRMTDVFKRYDDDRDGYITLSFEEFLTEIIRQLD